MECGTYIRGTGCASSNAASSRLSFMYFSKLPSRSELRNTCEGANRDGQARRCI